MALPTYTVVMTALKNIAAAALDDPTDPGSRRVWESLDKVAGELQRLSKTTYANLQLPRSVFSNIAIAPERVSRVVMTDELYANIAALVAAKSFVAGDWFVLSQATNDLTDNALATAKGGATAAGDVFVVLTGTTVLYIATRANLA